MPPLTPPSSATSIHGDDGVETMADRAERELLLGDEDIKMQENVENGLDRISNLAQNCCLHGARISRTILASEKTFAVWNILLSISYTLVTLFLVAAPALGMPLSVCEISLWSVMVTIYSLLLLSLIFVAALLVKALHPGLGRRKNIVSLAFRLVGTCTLLAIMLIERVVSFGFVAHHVIVDSHSSDRDELIRSDYRRTALEYAVSESLPVLFILFMMHRKRKKVQNNEVLIIHSIMNNMSNLFGSASPGDGAGSSAGARAGGLGSRRFQTYGGTRGDSFPPSLANKARGNVPRVSSSGGVRSKQQRASADDATFSKTRQSQEVPRRG